MGRPRKNAEEDIEVVETPEVKGFSVVDSNGKIVREGIETFERAEELAKVYKGKVV